MLSTIAAEIQDERLGRGHRPYRAVPRPKFLGRRSEATALNTQYIRWRAGWRRMARRHEVRAYGPTSAAAAARRSSGWAASMRVKGLALAGRLRDGKAGAGECGDGVILSSYVIDHLIGPPRPLRGQHAASRHPPALWKPAGTRSFAPIGLRWAGVYEPLPAALAAVRGEAECGRCLGVTALAGAARRVGSPRHVLRDPLTRRLWWADAATGYSELAWSGSPTPRQYHRLAGRKSSLLPAMDGLSRAP